MAGNRYLAAGKHPLVLGSFLTSRAGSRFDAQILIAPIDPRLRVTRSLSPNPLQVEFLALFFRY
jgi:hypothetical protein